MAALIFIWQMDSKRTLFREILVTQSNSYCTNEGDRNGILTREEEIPSGYYTLPASDHFCILLFVSSLCGPVQSVMLQIS